MAEDAAIIPPSHNNMSASFRQTVSWKISKEEWDREGKVYLELLSVIPGTYEIEAGTLADGWQDPYPGGSVLIDTQRIVFETEWSNDVDLDRIHVDAKFKVETSDGKCVVELKGCPTGKDVDDLGGENEFKRMNFTTFVSLNTDLLFDENGFFMIEADLLVEIKRKEAEKPSVINSNSYMEEIKNFFDDKNSDVVVVVGDKEFKCHKAILSARSEVFKNTLAHNTVESNSNTIEIRETPPKAVEDMLKYIYSGDVPQDPMSLTTDLLHIASMHQLHPVVEACLKNLVEGLDVPSCISTLMLVDRYLPQDQNMREMVIMFMQCKAKEVVEEEDMIKLIKSNPVLAQELIRKGTSVSSAWFPTSEKKRTRS